MRGLGALREGKNVVRRVLSDMSDFDLAALDLVVALAVFAGAFAGFAGFAGAFPGLDSLAGALGSLGRGRGLAKDAGATAL
jgi:hypothetical protein